MTRKVLCVLVTSLGLALPWTSESLAQAPDNPVVGISHDGSDALLVVTKRGDFYVSLNGFNWEQKPNAFGGAVGDEAIGIAALQGPLAFVVASNGRVVVFNGFTWDERENVFAGTSPGSVVGISHRDGALWAATASGEVRVSINGTQWQSRPSVFGGGVKTTTESWGALKFRYRD